MSATMKTTSRAYGSFGRALDYRNGSRLCVYPCLVVESKKTLEREERGILGIGMEGGEWEGKNIERRWEVGSGNEKDEGGRIYKGIGSLAHVFMDGVTHVWRG